ncbi:MULTISPECIES: hypothetical protein [Shinella]|uniref:N-acetyltransferase domain-containing protein n=1 Tax=Shinella sedimenti TaxID=2919913 RepID=A0ABT0CTN6_9HYPH|nr:MULTISPECIES: hypothetical protein [Shinella]MCJ8151965.1 hypothetical protein [Shinella sedimenti]
MGILGKLPEGLACRTIEKDDWCGVIDCLGRGFPEHPRRHWQDALERMAARPVVDDHPQHGYCLASEGQIVGVMLTLFFRQPALAAQPVRCNLSSWAVDEPFRSYAGKLIMTAMRRREVTFLSITPAPITLKVTEGLRFQRFADGQQAFLPALSTVKTSTRVVVARRSAELELLPEAERRLLIDHADLGCDALICVQGAHAYPFVLKSRRILRGLLPCSQVIYCRSVEALGQCAGAIGRHLLRKGRVLCVVDANTPIPGLVGRYFPDIGPKYYKGPNPPFPGDLAYTEFVLFSA